MKKNNRLEERRKSIPKDIDIFVSNSFDIVDKIHEILQAKNLDQKDLAVLLKKKESEISKWMSGTHNFTIKTLSKIEEVLDSRILRIADKNDTQSTPLTVLHPDKKYESLNQGKSLSVNEKDESTTT
jgi:transcriptional regulator with XRE-family HTH domain